MSFQDGYRNLIEDVYKREREREEELVQSIERKNLAIARYGESIRNVCSEFCRGVGYELKIHEHSEKRQGLRFWKAKEVYLTVYMGPKGSCVIMVDFRIDCVRIYPSADVKFDEIRLSFAEFSEEKLAQSLKNVHKQLEG